MIEAERRMAALIARGAKPEDIINFGVSEALVRGAYPEAGPSR
jgi:hypothetical protein